MMKNKKSKMWVLPGVALAAAVLLIVWAVARNGADLSNQAQTQSEAVSATETEKAPLTDAGRETEKESGKIKSNAEEAGDPETEVQETEVQEPKTGIQEPETGIQGFRPAQAAEDTEARQEPGQTEPADAAAEYPAGNTTGTVNGLNLPYKVPGTSLKIVQLGKYTGPFLEDGSDEPTENVASMVVENTSAQTVQYAKLTFQVNDKESAVFQLTTIPPGSSVLVMENSKRGYSKEDVYQYQDAAYAAMEELSLMEDKLKITAQDGKLTVENLTDEDLGMVYVRYKYFLSEDLYQGGITYETKFEKVGPHAIAEKEAPHYKEGGSRLMMAGYTGEEDVLQ